MPIIMERIGLGASFVTKDNPTGDRYNSPMVNNHVVEISHMTLPLEASGTVLAAMIITMYAAPQSTQPIPILVTLDVSQPLRAIFIHKILMSGANIKIKRGLKD